MSNESQFMNEYKSLIIKIINSQPSELKELIFTWLYITTNYITDFFNTKELKEHKKHTKKLKKIVAIQLEKIIKYYDDALKAEEI